MGEGRRDSPAGWAFERLSQLQLKPHPDLQENPGGILLGEGLWCASPCFTGSLGEVCQSRQQPAPEKNYSGILLGHGAPPAAACLPQTSILRGRKICTPATAQLYMRIEDLVVEVTPSSIPPAGPLHHQHPVLPPSRLPMPQGALVPGRAVGALAVHTSRAG